MGIGYVEFSDPEKGFNGGLADILPISNMA